MTTDEMLMGWLIVCRFNLGDGPGKDEFYFPDEVRKGWEKRGWVKFTKEDDGKVTFRATELGHTASDLVAPEWGVDPLKAGVMFDG